MEHAQRISSHFPILKKIQQNTDKRLKPEYLLIGMFLLLLVLTLSTPLGPLLTSTFGVVIPLKETLLILKQVEPKAKELKHLLIFWLLFGMLTALDAYSSWLVSIIPFFYTFKLFFLLYVGPFRFGAGELLYEKVISKIPESYYRFEGAEDVIQKAAQVAQDAVKEVKEAKDETDIKKVAGVKKEE
ncbi:ER membrane protein DP1/Yop1 [Binucleata daphniae]